MFSMNKIVKREVEKISKKKSSKDAILRLVWREIAREKTWALQLFHLVY